MSQVAELLRTGVEGENLASAQACGEEEEEEWCLSGAESSVAAAKRQRRCVRLAEAGECSRASMGDSLELRSKEII